MRNAIMFLLLFGAMTTFSSSSPVEKTLTPFSGQIAKKPIVLITSISNTWYNVDGCNITIEMPIAFIFDSNTLTLIGIQISNHYNVTIDCGSGGVMWARPATDVDFTVNSGKLDDVQFQTTNDSKLDKLYLDKTFKLEFMDWVKNNQPQPK